MMPRNMLILLRLPLSVPWLSLCLLLTLPLLVFGGFIAYLIDGMGSPLILMYLRWFRWAMATDKKHRNEP